jgi:hypothetical protein
MVHPSQNCGMCNKAPGLPIFFVRGATATQASNAPKFGDSFKEPPIPLGAKATYTPRQMRPGYVYLYNPADEHEPWRGFVVTRDSHYYPFRIGGRGPESVLGRASEVTPCKPNERGAIAQAVVLPRPEEAGDIWVTYSDVEWTKAVWQNFNDNVEGCRNKVMRKFDVKNWLSTQKDDHAVLIKDMAGKIADFSDAVKVKEFDFSADPLQRRSWSLTNWGAVAREVGAPPPADPHSPTPEELEAITRIGVSTQKENFNSLVKKSNSGAWDILVSKFERLSAGSDKTRGKGVVLALDDVAGVTADLAALMSSRVDAFHTKYYSDEKNLRKLKAGLGVMALREQVREQAIRRAESVCLTSGGMAAALAGDRVTDISEAELADIAENAWKPFEVYYDEKQIEQSQNDYSAKLLKFNEEELSDLAKAHVQWMEGQGMKAPLRYCYDEEHFDSGLVYSYVVSRSIGATQEIVACAALYEKWMGGEASDKENYLLRSLLSNQKEDLEFAQAYANEAGGKSFIDQKKLWDKLQKETIKQGLRITEDALKKQDSLLGRLLNQLAGAFFARYAQAAEAALQGGKMPFWMGIASRISGQPIPLARVSASSGGGWLYFAGQIIDDMVQRTQQSLGTEAPRDIRRHFRFASKGLVDVRDAMDRGSGAQAGRVTHIFYPIDVEVYDAEFKKGLKGYGTHTERALHEVRQSAMKEAIKAGKFKNLRGISADVVRGAGSSAVSIANGVLSGIFQYAAFGSIMREYEKEKARHPEIKSQFASDMLVAKFWQWGFATYAVSAEITSKAMERMGRYGLRCAQGATFEKFGRLLKGSGRLLGTAAAGMLAYMDWKNFDKARIEGKTGLRNAYFASSIVSSGFTALAAYPLIAPILGAKAAAISWLFGAGVFAILTIAAIVVLVWRMDEERKANIREWLARSIFGKEEKRKDMGVAEYTPFQEEGRLKEITL